MITPPTTMTAMSTAMMVTVTPMITPEPLCSASERRSSSLTKPLSATFVRPTPSGPTVIGRTRV
ncbi:hypothetical protein DPMN_069557 [Dreissena polymorpha]|uniref:Uncharacterized protein n=1 Tax=Dreissena polymorpha TaxID=45954 RepID=A0A9D3Z3T8_DREPO|nr:hypothetical protein DPMN_069557 [Dreissena polymorpha]